VEFVGWAARRAEARAAAGTRHQPLGTGFRTAQFFPRTARFGFTGGAVETIEFGTATVGTNGQTIHCYLPLSPDAVRASVSTFCIIHHKKREPIAGLLTNHRLPRPQEPVCLRGLPQVAHAALAGGWGRNALRPRGWRPHGTVRVCGWGRNGLHHPADTWHLAAVHSARKSLAPRGSTPAPANYLAPCGGGWVSSPLRDPRGGADRDSYPGCGRTCPVCSCCAC
jgi:hypothetical protein